MPVTYRSRVHSGGGRKSKATGITLRLTYPGTNPRDLKGLNEGPSLFVQPRLPGTVVGEISMRPNVATDKVTASH